MVCTDDMLNASILIVDDQEANVQLLEHMLREAGYRCWIRMPSARCIATTITT